MYLIIHSSKCFYRYYFIFKIAPGCTGVFLKMPEGVWALSDGEHPKPRYKGEGTIAIPMKCMEGILSTKLNIFYAVKYQKMDRFI